VKILVIDDDEDIGEFIASAAEIMDVSCIVTTKVKDFLAALNPDITLLMVDLMIPEIDGVELLRVLGKQQFKNNIILMSGADKRVLETAENLSHSLGLSVVGILQKPFRLAELEAILKIHSMHVTKSVQQQQTAIAQTITKKDLQLAIERDEFVIYYQPQIEIATNKVAGLEALMRWQNSKWGLIAPDKFIGLAESFGLIDQLGWLVIKRSLNEVKQFASQFVISPTLSINVSPYSLHDLHFPDKLLTLAKQSNVKPENITIEITESSLFKELTSALDILTRLRMKQFKLSIDDFGTGYAMMQQLQNVPANELKIDRSLVTNIHAQASSNIMLKKIIEMGHELGMKIVAEGVDNAEQLEFLRINKCDVAQGYLFSPPLAIPELQAWLNFRRSL